MKSFVSVILAQILWQFFRKIKMLFSRNLSLISKKKDSKKATFIWLLLNKFQNALNKILYNLKMYNWSDWRQNSWSIIRRIWDFNPGFHFQLERIRFSIVWSNLKQVDLVRNVRLFMISQNHFDIIKIFQWNILLMVFSISHVRLSILSSFLAITTVKLNSKDLPYSKTFNVTET